MKEHTNELTVLLRNCLERLRMLVDECIEVYFTLQTHIFDRPRPSGLSSIDLMGRLRLRYRRETLMRSMKDALSMKHVPEDELILEKLTSQALTTNGKEQLRTPVEFDCDSCVLR